MSDTLSFVSDVYPQGEIADTLLHQHNALFTALVAQSAVAISLTDADARIVYCNNAFCQLTGYTASQLIGQNHRILASRQTPRTVYDEMWHHLTQGIPWRGQLINQRCDGSLYLGEVDITPIFGSGGKVDYFLAMQKDISDNYALQQRLRNHMTLITAVLNNIPAAVVVTDGEGKVVMDNLAYKTLCADCGGMEALSLLGYQHNEARQQEGKILPLIVRGKRRWFNLSYWPLPGVSEEASRYFTDNAQPRTLVLVSDCTELHQQQQQGRLDRLKQQLTYGKLLAAIRESVDAALVQLNCPINMLAAARRLNGDEHGNMALESAWREGEAAVSRLQACRPELDNEPPEWWLLKPLLADLVALYHTRFQPCHTLNVSLEDSAIQAFGHRIQVLAVLSLWLDRALVLVQELQPFQLEMQILGSRDERWLTLYLTDNIPVHRARYSHNQTTATGPGQGMELRLMQTLVANHQGAIDLTSDPEGGSCLTIRLPLPAATTGGTK
jgi:nitrogen fixation negative regulator NifL